MIGLSIIGFMAVFAGLAFFSGMADVWSQLQKLSIPLLLGLALLSCVNYTFRGLKWHYFGERLQLNVPLRRMAIYYLSGSAMTVTPGKLGTALRLWYLKKGHGVSYSKGLPLMIMDPITDIIALLVMAIAGAVAFGGGHESALVTFTLIMSVLLTLFACPKLFFGLIKLVYRLCGKRNPRRFVTVKKGVSYITELVNGKVFVQTVLFSAIGWSATIISFWWLLDSLGVSLSIWTVMFVFSLSTLLGGAVMTPGGLVSTELSMLGLLAFIGVPADVALTATLVIRATTLWLSVFIGLGLTPIGLRLVRSSSSVMAK